MTRKYFSNITYDNINFEIQEGVIIEKVVKKNNKNRPEINPIAHQRFQIIFVANIFIISLQVYYDIFCTMYFKYLSF